MSKEDIRNRRCGDDVPGAEPPQLLHFALLRNRPARASLMCTLMDIADERHILIAAQKTRRLFQHLGTGVSAESKLDRIEIAT